jgi:hypothetical protein
MQRVFWMMSDRYRYVRQSKFSHYWTRKSVKKSRPDRANHTHAFSRTRKGCEARDWPEFKDFSRWIHW